MTEANAFETANSAQSKKQCVLDPANTSLKQCSDSLEDSASSSSGSGSPSNATENQDNHDDVHLFKTSLVDRDENQNHHYKELLHQKDKRIQALEAENKSLRSLLGKNSAEYQTRIDELVQELERHVELVDELQEKIKQLSSINNRFSNNLKRSALNHPASRYNHQSSRPSSNNNSGHYESQAPPPQDSMMANDDGCGAPDDIFAALSTFVEKNKQNGAGDAYQQQSFGGVNGEEELSPALVEYITKTLTDGSAAQSDNDAIINELLKNPNLISLLFDPNQLPIETSEKLSGCNGNNRKRTGHNSGSCMNGGTYRNGATVISQNTGVVTAGAPPRGTANGGKFSSSISALPLSGNAPKAAPTAVTPTVAAPTISATTTVTPSSAPSSNSSKPFTEEEMHIIDMMQERVANNLVRIGNRPLNTVEIAKQCKRLMIAYNIGQRLFAKAVMCQVVKSQGSLSELLSKPREWHKLTDKGREAFRRIFGWLSDDKAIELLCSLSPRRVALPCDKIEHPSAESLLDVSVTYGMLDDPSNASLSQLAASYNNTKQHGDGSSFVSDNGEFTVVKAKPPSTANTVKSSFYSPDVSACGSPPPNINGNGASAATTMNGYAASAVASSPPSSSSSSVAAMEKHLSPASINNNISNGLKMGSRWRHDDIPREKIIGILEAEKAKLRDQETDFRCGSPASSKGSSGAAPSLKKMSGLDALDAHSLTLALNGDMASTPGSPKSSLSSLLSRCRGGALKAEPAPIVQEQFEKYQTLDTEEVVKQVKEYLSTHSVSQRQFGETVLGLSQGSVSDLLARPKAWSLLTHKGREPFIRMKIFLDEHADDPVLVPTEGDELYDEEQNSGAFNFGMEEECRETPEPSATVTAAANANTDELLSKILNTIKNEQRADESAGDAATRRFLASVSASDDSSALDTYDLCRRIKEFLTKNGVSQRVFGEQVMGITSGSVSEMLSRPKPWAALSYKGRESYVKMANFLSDEAAMNALRYHAFAAATAVRGGANTSYAYPGSGDSLTVRDVLSNEYSNGGMGGGRTAGATAEIISRPLQLPFAADNDVGHSPSSGLIAGTSTPMSLKRKAVDNESNGLDFNGSGQSANGSGAPPGKKVPRFQRTIITDQQREMLFFVYSREQRPSTRLIDQLSSRLGLSSRTVTNWFHNYRTRSRPKLKENAGGSSENGASPVVVQTPRKPLEIGDPTTKSWYKELNEIVEQNASSNNANSSSTSYMSSMLGEHYDPLASTSATSTFDAELEALISQASAKIGGGQMMSSLSCLSGDDDGNGDANRAEDDGGSTADETRPRSNGSGCASDGGASSSGGGGAATGNSSQLDRAIARMHNRLAAGGMK